MQFKLVRLALVVIFVGVAGSAWPQGCPTPAPTPIQTTPVPTPNATAPGPNPTASTAQPPTPASSAIAPIPNTTNLVAPSPPLANCGPPPHPPPPPPPPPTTTITMGETSCSLPVLDGGNNGQLLTQVASLAQGGTLQSLSFCVTNPAGQMRLGVYDLTGNIIVQTAVLTPVAGWNTQPVGNVPITAGNYNLAYEPSDGNLTFPSDQDNGSCQWYSWSFAAMPPTLPAIAGGKACHWSLYATLSVP